MVWNLSQRHYDYKAFYDMIQYLGWPDHHAPALSLLFKIVSAMDSYESLRAKRLYLDARASSHVLKSLVCDRWLKADKKNVAVVHCMVHLSRDAETLRLMQCLFSQAGKGRTGTVICSYLLYCGKATLRLCPSGIHFFPLICALRPGEFDDPLKAIRFFGRKR